MVLKQNNNNKKSTNQETIQDNNTKQDINDSYKETLFDNLSAMTI